MITTEKDSVSADYSDDSIDVKVSPILIPKDVDRGRDQPSRLVNNGLSTVGSAYMCVDVTRPTPIKRNPKYSLNVSSSNQTERNNNRTVDRYCGDTNYDPHVPFRPWKQGSLNDEAQFQMEPGSASNLTKLYNLLASQIEPFDSKETGATIEPYKSPLLVNNNSKEATDNLVCFSKYLGHPDGPILLKRYRNGRVSTKQRRIEANARERTRVHAISTAFETLRKCIPSYSNNQRLCKLSILKIARSYIISLSALAGDESSRFEGSVNLCSATIQSEMKTKRKCLPNKSEK